MGLDVWFPLAVHHEDLGLGTAVLDDLVEAVLSHARRDPDPGAAWTGDVDGVDDLHHDPSFDVLTDAVAAGVWAYLTELGHHTEDLDLMVQRAWPVVAAAGSTVAPHVHPTAHVSAVVHLRSPATGGQLRFTNAAQPNELAPGAGAGSATHLGPLTFGSAAYEAVPGRLVIFPAKQRHEVLAHEGTENRVSVSYDLVVSSRSDRPGGVHEFVMPPPERWRRLPRPVNEHGADARGRVEIATLGRTAGRVRHAFADPHGHVLWGASRCDDVLSRASASAARAAAQNLTPPAGTAHPTGGDGDSGASDGPGSDALLEAFRCVVDVVDEHLSQRGVATLGALVSPPAVVRPGSPTMPVRADTDLVAWLRLDEDGECDLEVAGAGEDPPQRWALAPRSVLVAGGYRASRLVGTGIVVRVGVDVPSLARPGAASSTCRTDRPDEEAFLLATALPLTGARPSAAAVAAAVRARPPVGRREEPEGRRLVGELSMRLLDRGEDLTNAGADEIDALVAGSCGGTQVASADVTRSRVLDPAECEALVRHARAHLSGLSRDSVDGLPQYQVDLRPEGLDALLGGGATHRLSAAAPGHLAPSGVFVRHFSDATRPFIPFHHDDCHWTVNVPLEDSIASAGGDLVMLLDGALQVAERRRGWAISHPGTVVHGVRRVTSGDRWSLIAFYDDTATPARTPHPTPPGT